jgi:hypothetical protein
VDVVAETGEGEGEAGEASEAWPSPAEVDAMAAVVRAEAAAWDAADALEALGEGGGAANQRALHPDLAARLPNLWAAVVAVDQEIAGVRHRRPGAGAPPPPPSPPLRPRLRPQSQQPVLLPAMALLMGTPAGVVPLLFPGVAIFASWCFWGRGAVEVGAAPGGGGEGGGGGGGGEGAAGRANG